MPTQAQKFQENVEIAPEELAAIFDKCGKRAVEISQQTGASLSSVQGKNAVLVKAGSRSALNAAVELVKRSGRPRGQRRGESAPTSVNLNSKHRPSQPAPKTTSNPPTTQDVEDTTPAQHHEASCAQSAVEVGLVRAEDWALAVCMAAHPRLGAQSKLGLLEPDLLQAISHGLVIYIPRDMSSIKEAVALVDAGKAAHIHISQSQPVRSGEKSANLRWEGHLTVNRSVHITCESSSSLHGTWDLRQGSLGSFQGVTLCADRRVVAVTSCSWHFEECSFLCAATSSWPNAVRTTGCARASFLHCKFGPMRGGEYDGDAGSGLAAYDQSTCRLRHCRASGLWYSGFCFFDRSQMEMVDCTVEDSGYGVVMWGGVRGRLDGCVLRRNRDGGVCASGDRAWSGRKGGGGGGGQADDTERREKGGEERAVLVVSNVQVEGGKAWAGHGDWSRASRGGQLVGGGGEMEDGEYRTVLPASRDLAHRLRAAPPAHAASKPLLGPPAALRLARRR